MKSKRDSSLQIRLATIAILALLIVLAAAAYLSGRQVKEDSNFIAEDAVPGTIDAHYMRMAISRSIGWVLVAASAQTPEFRETSLKTVHDARDAFAASLQRYESTIRLNPAADRALLELVKSSYAAFDTQLRAYEALIVSGSRDETAAFLEKKVLPTFIPAIKSAEDLIKYNHANSIALSGSIRHSVNLLYWAVAVVVVLALACAVVLVFNLTVRRRELAELQENEEKFAKAFRANPSGIAITELETGRYIEVNDTFCKILGYPPEEILGYTTLDKGVWSTAEERERFIQPLLAGGTLRGQELQARTRYGLRKTLSLNAEIIELAGRRCIVTLVEDISERRQLERQQAELAAIVESSEDAIIGKTLEGIITSWNRGAEKIFGYTAAEAVGQPLLMIFPPERRHEEVAILARISLGETVDHFDTERVCKDGRRIFISATISPLRDGSGKVIGASKIARDITAQKRTEARLRDSEELFRTSFECATTGVCLVAKDGKFFNVNRTLCEMFGYTKEELLQLTFNDITHEQDREIGRSFLEHALAGGPKTMQSEKRYLHKDGHIVWGFLSTAVIDPPQENGGYLISYVQDITQRKQAEEALASTTELLERTSAMAKVGGWELDLATQKVTWSAETARLHEVEYPFEQPLLKNATDFYGPEAWPAIEAAVQAAIAHGTSYDLESPFITAKGNHLWVRVQGFAVIENGRTTKLRGTFQDITARKQADEALRTKQQQLILAMDIAKLAHWEFDVVNNTVIADEHLFQLLGTTSIEEGGLSMSPEEYIRKFVHPEDAGIVAGEAARGVASTDPHFASQFEHRIIRRDGTERIMLVRAQIVMDAAGRTGKILGTNQDITEQKQAELRISQLNRIYAVLSSINKTIVREKDPQAMLTEACRIAVENGGFRMAWVGMLDAETQKLQPVASAGVVQGYLDEINIDLRDQARSSGPTGRAFLSGEHVTCCDIEHDPLLAPWSAEALKRGYRSSACFPLRVGGAVTGVFTLYSAETGFFDEEELTLLDELAMDIGFALEVSEGESKRRQAEQELRWRTAFFEAQVHSALDGILVVDSTGKKLLQNRRMNELWKIPPHIADDPDATRQVQFVKDQVVDSQSYVEKVFHLYAHPDETSMDEIVLVDGTIMERYSAPVRGRDGTHYGRVWTFHDVTDYRRKEERFHRLFEADMQGVIFWNKHGQITEANDAYLKIVGCTREEFKANGLRWAGITPPEYTAADQRAMEEIAAKGVCRAYEKEFIRKDGVRVPILIGGARISQSSDEGVAFVLDLTERKMLEQQFLRAQRMESIGTLASGVAHDLNNILTPIMMSVAVLRMKIAEEKRAGLFDTIETSAARGAQIVKQVLTFGRGLEGEKHPLQMDLVMDEMEQMIRSTFPKGITLECVKAPNLWLVLGDATQLHQVLLNLCVNARDAMPEGGRLRMSATNLDLDASYASMLSDSEAIPGPYVLLEVSDTGTGIPPEVLERIFDPFFTTKGVGKGTGLGLSTVHGIVKSHGGLLKVITQPGEGTTFRIYLPAAPDQQALADAAALAPPPAGHGELVLVVDDEPAITQTARTVLEANGYRVLAAGDATEALVLFTDHSEEVALVLTDIMMPLMSGVLFLRTLRKIRSSIPVIASTGVCDQAQLTSMKELGIEAVLQKPYSSATLLRTLHSVLHPKA